MITSESRIKKWFERYEMEHRYLIMNTVTSLKTIKKNVQKIVEAQLSATGGLLRLAPCSLSPHGILTVVAEGVPGKVRRVASAQLFVLRLTMSLNGADEIRKAGAAMVSGCGVRATGSAGRMSAGERGCAGQDARAVDRARSAGTAR